MVAAGSPTPRRSQWPLRRIVAEGVATAALALAVGAGRDCPVILAIADDGRILDRQMPETSAARLDEPVSLPVAEAAGIP